MLYTFEILFNVTEIGNRSVCATSRIQFVIISILTDAGSKSGEVDNAVVSLHSTTSGNRVSRIEWKSTTFGGII